MRITLEGTPAEILRDARILLEWLEGRADHPNVAAAREVFPDAYEGQLRPVPLPAPAPRAPVAVAHTGPTSAPAVPSGAPQCPEHHLELRFKDEYTSAAGRIVKGGWRCPTQGCRTFVPNG